MVQKFVAQSVRVVIPALIHIQEDTSVFTNNSYGQGLVL